MLPMLEGLAERINADANLVRRGRYFTADFLIGVGDTDWLVEIEEGSVRAATPGPHMMRPWRFAIRAAEADWAAFCEPMPRPGHHDIFAMTKSGAAVIEGDLQPLMANLRYVKDLLASCRRAA